MLKFLPLLTLLTIAVSSAFVINLSFPFRARHGRMIPERNACDRLAEQRSCLATSRWPCTGSKKRTALYSSMESAGECSDSRKLRSRTDMHGLNSRRRDFLAGIGYGLAAFAVVAHAPEDVVAEEVSAFCNYKILLSSFSCDFFCLFLCLFVFT